MTNRYEQGLTFLQQIYEEGSQLVLHNLKEIAPDVGTYVVEMYGDLFSRPTLDFQQRQLVTIASLTALGGCENQLRWHIQASLNVGWTPNEIIESFIQGIPFHGFPRTLNAIQCAKQVFIDGGIHIEPNTEPKELGDRFERGLAKFHEVDGESGEHVIRNLADIAPDLGKQIIAFAFGDIYSRASLTLQQRQLITISSLTAQGGCDPQLHVHINGALNVGLQAKEIVEIICHSAIYVGFPKAINALSVAKKVFHERQLLPVQ